MGSGEVVGGGLTRGGALRLAYPGYHEARDLNREWLGGLQVPEPKTQKEATHIWADALSLSRTICASGSSISASDNNRFASS